MNLWRPVGLTEMALVFDAGMRAFPLRLPGQPIFYPVMNSGYATEIAREWNTKEAPFGSYVLRFGIPDDYGRSFEAHTVGSSTHRELWVPAERLGELNGKLSGSILVECAYFGADFRGDVPERYGLAGKDAYSQIAAMIATLDYAPFDFAMEISTNARTVFLNYPFWRAAGAARLSVAEPVLVRCLETMRSIWGRSPRPAPLIEAAFAA